MPRSRSDFIGVVSPWLCSLLLLCSLLGLGCTKSQPPPAATPTASVVFHPAAGGPTVQVKVELARTPDEQARGLMFRRSLEGDTGMLFLFSQPEIRRFWMRNTYIPLDMLFLDEKRVVVGVEENTVPLDETGRGPNQLAQYVVEVRGGYARSHGLIPGTRAEFLNVP